VRSSLALASREPSGDHATAVTPLVCPLRVNSSAPVTGSHRTTVRSSLALASREPSGDHATAVTPLVCPVRVDS
jgi:hypothetical protein